MSNKSDITELSKSPEQIRQELAIKDLMLETGFEPIFVLNSDGVVLALNEAAVSTFGFSKTSLIGCRFSEIIIGSNDRSRFASDFKKFAQDESGPLCRGRFETTALRSDQSEIPIEFSARAIRLEENVHYVIHTRDMTAEKKTELLLRESETRFRRLFDSNVLNQVSSQVRLSLGFVKTIESLVDVIISTELADWSVVYILEKELSTSRVIAKHRDPEQAENMSKLSSFVGPRLEKDSPADKVLRAGKLILIADFDDENFKKFATTPGHEEVLRKIGAKSAIMAPLFIEGLFVGGVSFVRSHKDIPYSREDVNLAEELVRRASISIENAQLYEKAQEAVTSRNDFVAMVSHDLKNPLSAILLNAAFIKRALAKEPHPTEKDHNLLRQVDAMERAAQRMNSLICDFLDLSRIESGRLVIDRQIYKLKTLIRDSLEMIQPLATVKSIQLSSLLMEELPETGYFDRERIFQVLSNLLGNAIKFTPDGGSVVLGLRLVKNELIFSVQDSGPGILKDQISHVFDRYWQAKENHRAGMGLGLNIAKGIVESHGGKIWVESEVDHGSTFHFSIPFFSN